MTENDFLLEDEVSFAEGPETANNIHAPATIRYDGKDVDVLFAINDYQKIIDGTYPLNRVMIQCQILDNVTFSLIKYPFCKSIVKSGEPSLFFTKLQNECYYAYRTQMIQTQFITDITPIENTLVYPDFNTAKEEETLALLDEYKERFKKVK